MLKLENYLAQFVGCQIDDKKAWLTYAKYLQKVAWDNVLVKIGVKA